MISSTDIDFEAYPLILASRRSELALVQTQLVRAQLSPLPSKILPLVTKGDEVLDRPLVEIGGKGVFIKALEAALLDGRADAAVHSMKDMETEIAPNTAIGAILPRGDRREALVGPYKSVDDLPLGAHIGTASVRRTALLGNLRPDLKIGLLRGNVNSRLARLESGEFDAIILAVAGLVRLGRTDGYQIIDEEILPVAVAQGALAVQVCVGTKRAEQVAALLSKLHCPDTASCVTAERALLAELDGSCRTPISAMADLTKDGSLKLSGTVLSIDGRQRFSGEMSAPRDDAIALGTALARQLLDKCGGRGFLT